jgi:hypothetical protein
MRLGELLAAQKIKPIADSSERGTFGGSEKTLPPGVSKKISHQAQTLSDHRDVVAQVAAQAKEQQGTRTDLLTTLSKSEPINTRAEIAKIAGVSEETIAKIEAIQREATPDRTQQIMRSCVVLSLMPYPCSIVRRVRCPVAIRAYVESAS